MRAFVLVVTFFCGCGRTAVPSVHAVPEAQAEVLATKESGSESPSLRIGAAPIYKTTPEVLKHAETSQGPRVDSLVTPRRWNMPSNMHRSEWRQATRSS